MKETPAEYKRKYAKDAEAAERAEPVPEPTPASEGGVLKKAFRQMLAADKAKR